MTPKIDIENYLKAKGIMTVGFCDAEPILDYAFFVNKEHHEHGNYFDVGHGKDLTDDRWYNPKAHLPSACSIITILLPYNLKFERHKAKPELALSKAAIFEDYHQMMKRNIEELTLYIEETYSKASIGFCDTGPLNDKAVLLKTDTVQILRNSLLYHKDYGSRFYIGYVITELDVFGNEDHKMTNDRNIEDYYHPYCKQCGKCAKSCPNKAIVDHGHLCSQKCISFLTQSKQWEELPDDLTLKGYVYGCDICQLVCPLNGKNLEAFAYNNVVSESVSIEDIESYTNREFKAIYNQSSAGWIGKKRFLRNAKWNMKDK